MKTYMGYADDPGEGACLVFAHNSAEAKKHAWPIIQNWWGCDYTDLRVESIKGEEYLFTYADKEKLANDEAHAIECVPCCERCEKWGLGPLDEAKHCPECAQEIEDDLEWRKEHAEDHQ